MKQIIGLLVMAALLATSSLAFAAKIPDGTYVDDSNRMFFTFSGNKLISGIGPGDGSIVMEETKTYEIRDGMIFATDKNGKTDKGARYTVEGDKLTLYTFDQGTVFTKK